MSRRAVVTGASGHLGNNLVRTLIARGEEVTAAVRAGGAHPALDGLDCRIATIDLRDERSLLPVFAGAETVYLAGAVFKHWARHAEREIYRANLQATRSSLSAAELWGAGSGGPLEPIGRA